MNEESSLPVMLHKLDSLITASHPDWRVIVVDDGSTDSTARILSEASGRYPWLSVLRHQSNRGLGAAIATALDHCRSPLFATNDADGTFPIERLPDLVALVQSGADVATASPWHPLAPPSGVLFFRALISRSASLLYRLVARVPVRTVSSLFRVWKTDVARQCKSAEPGFLAVTEMLVKAARLGYSIAELPLALGVREVGKSKMRFARTIMAHLRLLARYAVMPAKS